MCATRTCASNGLRLACFGLRVSIDLPISARPLSSHSPHRSDRRFLPSFFCTDVGVADFAAGVQSGPVGVAVLERRRSSRAASESSSNPHMTMHTAHW